MPKRISLQLHLSLDQLENRYRQAQDPVERSQFQILWLIALGKTTEQVQEVTGYCRDWIRKLVSRYNQHGPQGMGDHRHQNPGALPMLSDEQQARLAQALQAPPPDGGLWNSRKVADWMEQQLERPVYIQRGWDYLKSLEYSLQRPRPYHQEADVQAQEDFKKNCPSL